MLLFDISRTHWKLKHYTYLANIKAIWTKHSNADRRSENLGLNAIVKQFDETLSVDLSFIL